MLKGTTRIELTDVHTGEKEVIEKHNMVTNALSNIFQPTFGNYTKYYTMKNWIPSNAPSSLFGGLLLFDTALSENVNTLYAPAGASLTGSAAYNFVNNTESTKLGSYNIVESSFDAVNKRMTFVYDFATSQGNGVISSVCLTSLYSGYGSYGIDIKLNRNRLGIPLNSSDSNNITSDREYSRMDLPGFAPNYNVSIGNEYRFLLDVTNDQVYLFKLTDSRSITIIKRNARIKNRSLFSQDFPVITSQELTQVSTAIVNNCNYNYDSVTGCLYIISTTNNTVDNNGTMLVTKINITNNTVTQYNVTNKTGETLFFSYSSSSNDVICHQDYLYIKTNVSPYSIYKISITDSNTYTKLTGTFTNKYIQPAIALNGKIYWHYYYSNSSNSEAVYITDSQLNTTSVCGLRELFHIHFDSSSTYSAAITPIKDYPMFYHAGYYNINGQIFVLGSYLATINNLAQPITKTADRTMKITYVIEEVSSNT